MPFERIEWMKCADCQFAGKIWVVRSQGQEYQVHYCRGHWVSRMLAEAPRELSDKVILFHIPAGHAARQAPASQPVFSEMPVNSSTETPRKLAGGLIPFRKPAGCATRKGPPDDEAVGWMYVS